MASSCPVCYEAFDSSDEKLLARKLNCGDVICTGCILMEFQDGSFCCPECTVEHKGAVVSDFSSLAKESDFCNDTQSTVSEATDSTSVDESGNDSASRSSTGQGRTPCLESGCPNKALPNGDGYCLSHSKLAHIYNINAEDVFAKDLANTTLNSVALSGNRLMKAHKARKFVDVTPYDLIEEFKQQQRIQLGEALELIDRAKEIMFREPNILQLEAPLVAVGDIHGQFYDLINMLEEGGKPGEEQTYLFLGDYVDRGSFSCEVMLTLLKFKVMYPDRVWLLRGNHECRSVSGHFGFKEECKIKYGVNVYYRFLLLFQTMPLAAVINTAFGDIFACHGGLSPSLETLDDIQRIDRFVEPENDPGLLDMVWSDPVQEDGLEEMTDQEYEDYMMIDFRPNPARGCSYCFGYKAVKEFLDKNNLVCLVRAHEVQEDGFKKHFDPDAMEARMKLILNRRARERANSNVFAGSSAVATGDVGGGSADSGVTMSFSGSPMVMEKSDSGRLSSWSAISGNGGEFPPVITIFSAPNYCDRYANKAAILYIDSALNGFRVIQYECVEHPSPEVSESQTENHILAIINTCPYMPTSFRNFVRLAVELGPEDHFNSTDADGNNAEEEGDIKSGNIAIADTVPIGGGPAKANRLGIQLESDFASEAAASAAYQPEPRVEETQPISSSPVKPSPIASHSPIPNMIASPMATRHSPHFFAPPPPPASETTAATTAASASSATASSSGTDSATVIVDSIPAATSGDEQKATDSRCEKSADENGVAPSLRVEEQQPAEAGRRPSSVRWPSIGNHVTLHKSVVAGHHGVGVESKAKRRETVSISLVRQDHLGDEPGTIVSLLSPQASTGGAYDGAYSDGSTSFDYADSFQSPNNFSLPPMEPGLARRRSSSSSQNGSASADRHAHANQNKRASNYFNYSDVYVQAMVSDSINERHPQMLVGMMQSSQGSSGSEGDERSKEFDIFKTKKDEAPVISVSELRKRFEAISAAPGPPRPSPLRSKSLHWVENPISLTRGRSHDLPPTRASGYGQKQSQAQSLQGKVDPSSNVPLAPPPPQHVLKLSGRSISAPDVYSNAPAASIIAPPSGGASSSSVSSTVANANLVVPSSNYPQTSASAATSTIAPSATHERISKIPKPARDGVKVVTDSPPRSRPDNLTHPTTPTRIPLPKNGSLSSGVACGSHDDIPSPPVKAEATPTHIDGSALRRDPYAWTDSIAEENPTKTHTKPSLSPLVVEIPYNSPIPTPGKGGEEWVTTRSATKSGSRDNLMSPKSDFSTSTLDSENESLVFSNYSPDNSFRACSVDSDDSYNSAWDINSTSGDADPSEDDNSSRKSFRSEEDNLDESQVISDSSRMSTPTLDRVRSDRGSKTEPDTDEEFSPIRRKTPRTPKRESLVFSVDAVTAALLMPFDPLVQLMNYGFSPPAKTVNSSSGSAPQTEAVASSNLKKTSQREVNELFSDGSTTPMQQKGNRNVSFDLRTSDEKRKVAAAKDTSKSHSGGDHRKSVDEQAGGLAAAIAAAGGQGAGVGRKSVGAAPSSSSSSYSDDDQLFTPTEILGLRLMFSLFDRSGNLTIEYEDLVAYAEETGDTMGIRDAKQALDILDIDGDGKIGLLDFIHFAGRLKTIHLRTHGVGKRPGAETQQGSNFSYDSMDRV